MVDLTDTIKANSAQLTADDLHGVDLVLKITDVSATDTPEQPVRISYEGDNGKPYLPCKSMRRVLVALWGADGKSYIGKSLKVYRDPDVKWAGQAVGGIRISEMEGLERVETIVLAENRKSRKPVKIAPLKLQAAPDLTPYIEAGDKAAGHGVDAYKEWAASVPDDVKAHLKEKHKEWVAVAKAHDEGDSDIIDL